MSQKKILLVDDAQTVLLIEQMILGPGNFELVTATDGAQAVEMARSVKPDLILLDIVMPVMNGLDACRELRRLEETKAIPIIMVTTRSEEKNIELAYEAGCNDYVTKPIDGVELIAKVRDLVGE